MQSVYRVAVISVSAALAPRCDPDDADVRCPSPALLQHWANVLDAAGTDVIAAGVQASDPEFDFTLAHLRRALKSHYDELARVSPEPDTEEAPHDLAVWVRKGAEVRVRCFSEAHCTDNGSPSGTIQTANVELATSRPGQWPTVLTFTSAHLVPVETAAYTCLDRRDALVGDAVFLFGRLSWPSPDWRDQDPLSSYLQKQSPSTWRDAAADSPRGGEPLSTCEFAPRTRPCTTASIGTRDCQLRGEKGYCNRILYASRPDSDVSVSVQDVAVGDAYLDSPYLALLGVFRVETSAASLPQTPNCPEPKDSAIFKACARALAREQHRANETQKHYERVIAKEKDRVDEVSASAKHTAVARDGLAQRFAGLQRELERTMTHTKHIGDELDKAKRTTIECAEETKVLQLELHAERKKQRRQGQKIQTLESQLKNAEDQLSRFKHKFRLVRTDTFARPLSEEVPYAPKHRSTVTR